MKSHKAWWMAPLFSCMILAGIAGSAEADVVNGGFETGNFTGWTLGGDTSYEGVATFIEHSGTYGAYFGTSGEDPATLSQTVATTPGTQYLLTFWLLNGTGGNDGSNAFSVFFGGTELTGDGVPFVNGPAFPYTEYSFLVTAANASSALEFDFTQDNDEFNLDDVSLTATPLPAALPLFGAGLGLIGLMGRKKRKENVLPA